MAYIYDYLTTAGVSPDIASWGVVVVFTLCVATIMRLVIDLWK